MVDLRTVPMMDRRMVRWAELWCGGQKNGMVCNVHISFFWSEKWYDGQNNVMVDGQKNALVDRERIWWTEEWYSGHKNGMLDRRMVWTWIKDRII